jgi:DNA-binding transcriptional ArsR family regulator
MKNPLKFKAIELRKTGLSYGEIAKKLGVSKSTLSYWLKDVELTDKQRKKLYTNNILILTKGPQSQKERRKREVDKIIKEAEKEIEFPLSKETFRLFGAALYWAEGKKSGSFEITNSDPNLIIFIVKWFKEVFEVAPNKLTACLNIYPQQNERKIKKFWSDLTNIPIENFGKSYIKPLSKNYKTNNLYYGTIKVRVQKGTDMRLKTYGWIRAVLKEFNEKINTTEKKWVSLKETHRPINIY